MRFVSVFLYAFVAASCLMVISPVNVSADEDIALEEIVVTADDVEKPTGISQFAGCSGTDCSACNVVDLTNGLIKWLIGFLFVLFAVLVAYAGFGLVTSGGNHHALDEAKSRFMNAFIGMIIILSAWLIVDTIMRGLVGNASNPGSVPQSINSDGEVTGWLFWTNVQCYEQTEPDDDVKPWVPEKFDPYTAPVWAGDPSSPLSGEVTSVISCTATPAGNRDCSSAIAQCRSQNGFPQVNTENPNNHTVNCVVNSGGSDSVSGTGSGSAGCSGGSCVPLTIPCSARGCTIARDMVGRLAAMHSAAAVSGARVTEAMPPSRQHKSACHNNGTCVDYSKSGGMSAAEVLRVVNAASLNGLRAIYEVHTNAQKNALVSAGVPAGNVKVLGDWISAPHFSIYGY
jgi:hypothetical protein